MLTDGIWKQQGKDRWQVVEVGREENISQETDDSYVSSNQLEAVFVENC